MFWSSVDDTCFWNFTLTKPSAYIEYFKFTLSHETRINFNFPDDVDSSAKKAFQSSSQFNCLRISEKEGGEESGELRLYWEVKTVF